MSNTAQPLQPELLAPFPLRNPFHGLHFLVRPITDSPIAESASRTIQGVVHLELLRNVGGAIDPDPRPIRLAELRAVGIDPQNLVQHVFLERSQIGTKYLPSAKYTYMSPSLYVEDKEAGRLDVQYVISQTPHATRS